MTRHAQTSIGAVRAAAVAGGYGTLALVWTVTGRGFPFGPDDRGNGASPLRALTPEVGAPLFAAVLLLAAVAALILHGGAVPRGPARVALPAYLWLVVAALLVVVPDSRLLTVAGYLPVLVVGAPFGYPPVDYGDVFTVALATQALSVLTGLLLARATLRWQFRGNGACVACGRSERTAGWATPAGAARWGRWAAWTAAAIPAAYAVTRLAWAAGIPLGIPAEFLREPRDSGAVWAGAGLGGFALLGAVLTLGLVQRWGEVFPRWMLGLAGRRVPIRLATVPATLVAVFVTSASVGLVTADGFLTMFTGEASLATLPMLLWPFWGVALGAAALAYHLRRRGACRDCGRGAPGLVPAARTGAY
ncbi:hypothetical protein [Jidongwangia harbinensis]|uniref:hypothetical protein n=1 Tax=Jidongwangia harbinensis TaxID=2878561 RepID=UPI001CDA125B|nr:hypothetical protein [Jidongwangia harbinensis]MCA2219358.1 hypothetical protein [Jidongwangia harbinensis]